MLLKIMMSNKDFLRFCMISLFLLDHRVCIALCGEAHVLYVFDDKTGFLPL